MELVPGNYLLHIHRQTCTSCGNQEALSRLYRIYFSPDPRVKGNRLREVDSLEPGIGVGCTMLKEKTVPVCGVCIQQYEPPELPDPVAQHKKWREAVAAMQAKHKAATRPTPVKPVPPSIDDVPDF